MPRVLAVDYGKARVGLAVSDPLGHTAQPLEVVERPKRGSLVEAVLAVARRVEADEIVVGLPLRLDATEGVAAEAARAFARALGERSGLPVTLHDERLTTVEASRGMRAGGVSARGQRGVVDKVAAAVLLGAFLDARADARPGADELSPPEDEVPHEGSGRRAPGTRKRKGERSAARARSTERGSREEWLEDARGGRDTEPPAAAVGDETPARPKGSRPRERDPFTVQRIRIEGHEET